MSFSPPARVVVIPGLAVRTYVEPAVAALAAAGCEVELVTPPAWRGVPADLGDHGRLVADGIAWGVERTGRPVDLLIGLSMGTQSAAVAAARGGVERLLLVSPTVDPGHRTWLRLVAGWVHGDGHPASDPLSEQLPDWLHSDPVRVNRGLVSALRHPLEDVLPGIEADVTVVHAGWDNLSTFGWAARLADLAGGTVWELPDAPHSWPARDVDRFVSLVRDLLRPLEPARTRSR